MLLWRALPVHGHPSLGPLMFLDHHRHHNVRGVGGKPHPHAGIEVISGLLEGGVKPKYDMLRIQGIHLTSMPTAADHGHGMLGAT